MNNIDGRMVRRLAKYAELMKDYRKVRGPDLQKLAELVKLARGARSVRRFAEELGVSPSTISRLENGKASGISNELLVKIAEHADPTSGVSLHSLLLANGMDRPKNLNPLRLLKEFEIVASDVVRNELYQAGYSFVNAKETSIPGYNGYSPDMVMESNSINGVWMFDFMWVGKERDDRHTRWGAARVVEKVFQFMSIFYCGPSEIKKVSIVINSPETFDYVVESLKSRLDGIKIKDLMSVILIDEDKRYIAKEWYLPTEQATPKVFKCEPPKEPEAQDDLLNDLVEGQYNLFDVIAEMESKKNKDGDNDEDN